jgi:Xaa-Pro aminopeptidase
MNIYQQRLIRLKETMAARNIDALILTPGASMRYLTGFSEDGYERLLALLVTASGTAPIFITPTLNADQVRANLAGIADVRAWNDAQGWQSTVAKIAQEWGLGDKDVALDEDMPARFSLPLATICPYAKWTLAGNVLTPLRAVKDAAELDAMQRAADATDALLPSVYTACQVGTPESEIAQVIHSQIARDGHEASFAPIVGAGKNGAMPHHHTGPTPLQTGDVLVLDMGVKVDGYCGDITRTVALGNTSDEAKRIYEIVHRAYQAGIEAVRPGATGEDVDAAARRVIENAGYGEYFVHRTGHGIGLDDHEPPFIVAGNTTSLQPGECFSIEPGIYLPGKFGVRLENIVTMQEDGTARVFNEAIPAELRTL